MELNALTECHIKKYKNLALNLPFSSQYNITAVPARCVQTKEKHAEKREDKGKHDELKSKLNLNFSFGWPSDCIINATMSWANVANWEIGNSWSDIPFKIFNYSPAVDLNGGWYKLSQKLKQVSKYPQKTLCEALFTSMLWLHKTGILMCVKGRYSDTSWSNEVKDKSPLKTIWALC